MADIVLGIVVMVIGLTNIWIGVKGITIGPLNARIYARAPRLYRWLYVVGGVFAILVGIVILIGTLRS